MADFCRQCSIHLGAPAGWTDFAPSKEPRHELCEGCDVPRGITLIGTKGECVDLRCKCCPAEGAPDA